MKIQKWKEKGYRLVACLLCAVLLLSKVVMAQPMVADAASQGTILASSLYVRSGPGTTYDKMTVNGQAVFLTKNTKVTINSEKDGWYYITTSFEGQTVKGYVSGKYVSVEAAVPTKAPTKAPTKTPTKSPTKAPAQGTTATGALATEFSVPAQIWVTELNIRQTAGTSGAIVDTLKSGASVTAIGQTYAGAEKWYKVTYTSGGKTVTGYAYGPYVTLNAAIPTATPTPKATATPTPTKAPATGGLATEFSVPARVTASVLNVRSGAGTGNSLVTTLYSGAKVTATGVSYVGSEKWYRITFESGGTKKVGYVFGPYITLDAAIPTATPVPTATPTPKPTATPAPTATPVPEGVIAKYSIPATVVANRLNVREQAGTGSPIIAILVNTTKVTATGSCYVGADKWYCIEFLVNSEKKVGYVFGEYLQLSSPEPTATPTPTPTIPPTATPVPTAAPTPTAGATPTPSTGPVAMQSYRFPAKVSATQLNLRKGPGTEHEIVQLLVNGNAVEVTGEAFKNLDKWYKVTANGKEGYVLSDYIRLDYTTYPTAILTEKIRLRSGASDNSVYVKNESGAVAVLMANTRVSLTGEMSGGDEKWFSVRCEIDGETLTGFVPARQIKLGTPVEPTPAPTPTPTIAPTATPTPTPEATPTVAPEEPTPTPEATPTVAPEEPTPTPEATPTAAPEAPTQAPEVTPTVAPEVPTPTPELAPTPTPTPSPAPSATPVPPAEVTPTATPTPGAGTNPKATPAAEAKENTAGVQIGWGKATHPSASSMVLKILPKSGVASVKLEEGGNRAVTITGDNYLMLYDLYEDEKGNLYRHVGVTKFGKDYYGYILEERITECEAPPTPSPTPTLFPGFDGDFGDLDIWGNGDGNNPENNPGVVADFELTLLQQGFPESYKPKLRQLHEQYPNWVFQAYHTGLLWDMAITEENIPGKNLIPNSSGIEWKSLEEGAYNWKTDSFIVYDGSTWVTASRAALEYYMDPRNFLDEKSIFQFEALTYEPTYQNLDGIENILKYTPLYKTSYVYEDANGIMQAISYGETFIKAAEYSGVSPYHLATRVKQEVVTGTTTVSNSVTGTVKGYEGLYNFYNIGAYHSTQAGGAIANGLKYAKYGSSSNDALNDSTLIPWDNRYSAIVGGAYFIGDSYINRGQNTIYLQKFNMTPYYTYSHQYMANVVAPSSEGKKTALAYTGAADSPVVFSIPVFLGMPESACPMPTPAYNPNNYLSKLAIKALDGTTYPLTPSFDGANVTTYSVIVDNSTEVISIEATAVSKKAAVSGVGYHPLEVGTNELTLHVIAENGSVREYKLYVARE